MFRGVNFGVRFVIDNVNAVGFFEPEVDTAANERAIDIGNEVPLAFGTVGGCGTTSEFAVLEDGREFERFFRMRAGLSRQHFVDARAEFRGGQFFGIDFFAPFERPFPDQPT